MRLTLPPAAERFSDAVHAAFAGWFGAVNASATVLSGGLSGALVLKVELSGLPAGDVRPGEYILKVRSGEAGEATSAVAHARAAATAADFSARHMPVMAREHRHLMGDSPVDVTLFSVAGGSLRRYVSCARPASAVLEHNAAVIIEDVTQAWSDPNRIEDLTVEGALRRFMGEVRFEDSLIKIDALLPDNGLTYTRHGLVLSPRKLLRLIALNEVSTAPMITAMNHRDLHGGNILIDADAAEPDYYVIDFDESSPGLAGYDAAYLEVERFFRNCEGLDTASVRGLVSTELDLREQEAYPANVAAFLRVRDAIRIGEERAWRRDGWEDARRRQSVLARIAAALIWLRRDSLTAQAKEVLAFYVGAQCAVFLETYHPALLSAIDHESVPSATELPSYGARETWLAVRARLGRLDGLDSKLILIAERDHDPVALASLGLVPWQAVIDLDPTSSETGLFSTIAANLESVRGVHRFSRVLPQTLSPRGCGWMFANGWPAVGEKLPTDRDWQYRILPLVRQFGKQVHDLAGDTPVTVLVLGGTQAGPAGDRTRAIDKISSVISALDEAFAGRIDFLCCGVAPRTDLAELSIFDISQTDVARLLADELGTSAARTSIEIPGVAGLIEIPSSLSATLSESFEILHRRLGLDQFGDMADSNFIRGGRIDWADLHDGLDVHRDLYKRLVHSLEEALQSRRTRTVILHHNPGAGATTLARRLAWDLRLAHPVCVIHQDSLIAPEDVVTLADRLKALYERAEQPVLCLAESSSLSESGREQLYRLLSTSGTRVVILYVRRVFSTTASEHLELLDPMSSEEAERFVELFRNVMSKDRLPEIIKLSRPEYERYRSPFFFGLTAFERDFRSLESYVANHVAGILGRRRDVLEYIAFVTSFSAIGLDLSTVHRLLGFEPRHGLLSLGDLFGESVERLLIQRVNKVKVVHPIVAEEILDELVGGGRVPWRNHAHEVAQEFIRDLGTLSESDSVASMDLLRQIFIERPGTRFDDVEDRNAFSPLIELLDDRDASVGHKVLSTLTQYFPADPHFWTHLGRHQIYRLNRDIEEAVGFVERAVTLSPDDPIHHHVLGQVNRFRMKEIARQHRKQDADEILEVIRAPHTAAIEAFTESRRLAPDNIYGYITHMQTTIEAAKALAAASKVASISEVGSWVVQEWVQEHLAVVSELADAAATLYRTLDDRDDYLRRCLADLQRLYGDLDRAIELWEVTADSGGSTAYGRRALANAYLARADRRWSQLTEDELRRILDLMRRNIRAPRPTDEDFRLWFEAFRQSSEFDIDDALVNLAVWKDGAHGWRPSFYASVLAFLLWFNGRSVDLADHDAAVAQSRSVAIGRTRDSLLWLASGPEACPLLSTGELGAWDSDARFWSDTRDLRRVNGVIDQTIVGPQAGSILVDGSLRVFFVPAAGGFTRNSDEGREVNFFLAFTPEGPRAWDVMLGHFPGAFRRRVGDVKHIEWVDRVVEPTVARTNGVRDRILAFVAQLVRARAGAGLETTPADVLIDRVAAVFATRLDADAIAGMIGDLADIEWTDGGANVVAMGEPNERGLQYGEVTEVDRQRKIIVLREVRRTQRVRLSKLPTASVPFLVRFERTASGDIDPTTVLPLPKGTAVFDGRTVGASDLLNELATYGLIKLDQFGDGKLKSSALESDLAARYIGPGSLLDATGYRTLSHLVAALPGLLVKNGLVARVGSVDPHTEDRDHRTPIGEAASDSQIVSVLAEATRVHHLDALPLVLAGQLLSEALGVGRYKAWRGNSKLAVRLSAITSIEVTEQGRGNKFVRVFTGSIKRVAEAAPYVTDAEIVAVLGDHAKRRPQASIFLADAGNALSVGLGPARYQIWRKDLPLSVRLRRVRGVAVAKKAEGGYVVTLEGVAK